MWLVVRLSRILVEQGTVDGFKRWRRQCKAQDLSRQFEFFEKAALVEMAEVVHRETLCIFGACDQVVGCLQVNGRHLGDAADKQRMHTEIRAKN